MRVLMCQVVPPLGGHDAIPIPPSGAASGSAAIFQSDTISALGLDTQKANELTELFKAGPVSRETLTAFLRDPSKGGWTEAAIATMFAQNGDNYYFFDAGFDEQKITAEQFQQFVTGQIIRYENSQKVGGATPSDFKAWHKFDSYNIVQTRERGEISDLENKIPKLSDGNIDVGKIGADAAKYLETNGKIKPGYEDFFLITLVKHKGKYDAYFPPIAGNAYYRVFKLPAGKTWSDFLNDLFPAAGAGGTENGSETDGLDPVNGLDPVIGDDFGRTGDGGTTVPIRLSVEWMKKYSNMEEVLGKLMDEDKENDAQARTDYNVGFSEYINYCTAEDQLKISGNRNVIVKETETEAGTERESTDLVTSGVGFLRNYIVLNVNNLSDANVQKNIIDAYNWLVGLGATSDELEDVGATLTNFFTVTRDGNGNNVITKLEIKESIRIR
ncbi:MAG: hypothetical protein LBD99_06805, partial [Candidatus Margulisbacteria bacterium]|nr:hypothetical protein [Candidatus Margulisiibacteriota bacterium]